MIVLEPVAEESSTLSPEEAAQIRAEVQAVMKYQFAKARANLLAHAKLESNLVASCKDSLYTSAATANPKLIDLITQSIASLQKSQPTILSGSPILLA